MVPIIKFLFFFFSFCVALVNHVLMSRLYCSIVHVNTICLMVFDNIIVTLYVILCGFSPEESERALTVCEVQENGDTGAGSEPDNSSNALHCAVDQHYLDTASDSYRSCNEHQMVTDQKPPLMKKSKGHRRNVASFRENVMQHNISSSDTVPEALGSAEPVRRRLRLPWKKKQKSYMPGKETNQWRSDFESWRSASQLSLETCSELDNASNRSIRRTASQSDLDHTDSHSVGWSDSDSDTVASDDHLGGSLNERGIYSSCIHSLSSI